MVTPYAMTSRWGVNRHIRGLARALGERGHEVSIIAPAEERNAARTARQRARLARRVARDAARTGAPMYIPSAEEDNKSERLFKISGTFRLPYSESIANLALPKDVTDHLNELLAREDFDILHLHEPYPPNLSFTALRLARCPVVATFHTAGERFLSFQLLRPVVERFFSRLDGRICTSQNTRRIVSGHFPGEYRVIGGGVDTRLFRPRKGGGAAKAVPLVMYAAWGEPRWGSAAWPLLALGLLAPVSLVNTYEHLHAPLLLSLARSGIGLALGLALGWTLWRVVLYLEARWPLRE